MNAGTLSKTVGTNVSTISTLLNNTGTVAVSTGTLNISGSVSQVTGTTLTAGIWSVSSTPTVQSTVTFASPPLLTTIGVGASVTLSGPHSSFTNLAGLNANAGSFSLTGGLGFTTTGSLTNSGTIILAASDVLAVAGSYTQTATGTLSDTIAGTAASGKFGAINATGAASLGGTLAITVPSSFSPTMGDTYPIMAYSSHTGTFATITGLSLPGGLSLVPGYNAKNVALTVSTSVGGAALAIVAQPGPELDRADKQHNRAVEVEPALDQAHERETSGPSEALSHDLETGSPIPPCTRQATRGSNRHGAGGSFTIGARRLAPAAARLPRHHSVRFPGRK